MKFPPPAAASTRQSEQALHAMALAASLRRRTLGGNASIIQGKECSLYFEVVDRSSSGPLHQCEPMAGVCCDHHGWTRKYPRELRTVLSQSRRDGPGRVVEAAACNAWLFEQVNVWLIKSAMTPTHAGVGSCYGAGRRGAWELGLQHLSRSTRRQQTPSTGSGSEAQGR